MTGRNIDVTIIGGGMTGLSLACAMSGIGLSILVIDARGPHEPQSMAVEAPSGSFQFDSGFAPRVSSINLAAEALLQKTGVWQHLANNRSGVFSRMLVWDGEGTGATEFDSSSIYRDHLGHVIENRVVLQALLDRIRELDDVEYIAPLSLESIDHENIDLRFADGSSAKTSLIVGADGGNSTVRNMLQFETREWSYTQAALVTTVRTEHPHEYTAWQCFTSAGPLAFLPLADEHLSSIVWSVDPEYSEQLLGLEAEAFCDQVGRAFEQRLGLVMCTDQRYTFPLQQCHAKRYVQPGVALAGDTRAQLATQYRHEAVRPESIHQTNRNQNCHGTVTIELPE
jgi:2-octaprenylphenol hydroxylase